MARSRSLSGKLDVGLPRALFISDRVPIQSRETVLAEEQTDRHTSRFRNRPTCLTLTCNPARNPLLNMPVYSTVQQFLPLHLYLLTVVILLLDKRDSISAAVYLVDVSQALSRISFAPQFIRNRIFLHHNNT